MMKDEISLCEGKYRFGMDDRGVLVCFRHGESWRTFIGDNAVLALYRELVDLRAATKTQIPIGESNGRNRQEDQG